MHGGGISVYVTGPERTKLMNVEISNNNAAFWGGAAMFYSANVDMINTTVAQNTDNADNSAIKNQDGNLSIINSIVWSNYPNTIGGQSSIIYSNVSSNTGEGNIQNVDPLFVNAGEGDFNIQADSPCRDSGTSDIDGDGIDDIIVFQGESPDMGAYEYTIAHPEEFTFTIENNSITLSWNPSTDDDFQYYSVQMSTDSLFNSEVLEYYTPDSYYTFNQLEYNIPYYFRVATMVGQNEWSYFSDIVTVTIEFVSTDDQNIEVPFTFS